MILILFLLLGATSVFAQKLPITTSEFLESKYRAELKEKLAIDYSMPDYITKKVNANIMGAYMASMVNTFVERSTQMSNQRVLNKIIGDQVESLKYYDYGIKKMKFINASKKGNELTLLFKVWLSKNINGIKQTELSIRFIDGVSENNTVNDFFRYISISAKNDGLKN